MSESSEQRADRLLAQINDKRSKLVNDMTKCIEIAERQRAILNMDCEEIESKYSDYFREYFDLEGQKNKLSSMILVSEAAQYRIASPFTNKYSYWVHGQTSPCISSLDNLMNSRYGCKPFEDPMIQSWIKYKYAYCGSL